LSKGEVKIGIDTRGDLFYTARIEEAAGRPDIKALARFERAHLAGHQLLQGGDVILSVPDDKVIQKRLALSPGDGDAVLRAKFELAQTLPEDEKEFLFDVIPCGCGNRYLGLAVRREQLAASFADYSADNFTSPEKTHYRMRAAALAKGYLAFCRPAGGDLVCVADFNDRQVSAAFVYQGQILGLSHCSLERLDLDFNEDLKRMAIEFKTVVNFALASFFREGVTTPLSALVIAGDGSDGRYRSVLTEYFSISTDPPRINPGFVAEQHDTGDIPMEKYLVALGLTVI